MLWSEEHLRRDAEAGEDVDDMDQIARDGRRMGQQADA